jgi:hypothetical protein
MSVNAEGERAIEVLSGKELHGRALTVNEARQEADRVHKDSFHIAWNSRVQRNVMNGWNSSWLA